MQRRLRTCIELPPRHSRGAASSSSTLLPASRAVSAAQRAALPPPTTMTSHFGVTSLRTFARDRARDHFGRGEQAAEDAGLLRFVHAVVDGGVFHAGFERLLPVAAQLFVGHVADAALAPVER